LTEAREVLTSRRSVFALNRPAAGDLKREDEKWPDAVLIPTDGVAFRDPS
jgi:hypothetical protein